MQEFAFPNARGIKHFQDGAVAIAENGGRVRRLDDFLGLGGGQNALGQSFGFTHVGQTAGWIVGKQTFVAKEFEKAAHSAEHAVDGNGGARRSPRGGRMEERALEIYEGCRQHGGDVGDAAVGEKLRQQAKVALLRWPGRG